MWASGGREEGGQGGEGGGGVEEGGGKGGRGRVGGAPMVKGGGEGGLGHDANVSTQLDLVHLALLTGVAGPPMPVPAHVSIERGSLLLWVHVWA
jgi:hypothetical protein